jgi:nitroreductase
MIIAFGYDIKRFFLYSGWLGNMKDFEKRNYYSVMVYHSLEKSMSYKNRKIGSGWSTAYKLIELIKIADKSGKIGYFDRAAKDVLESFINLEENKNSKNYYIISKELNKISFDSINQNGIIEYKLEDFNKGKLDNPELFFNSRYSLREFSNQIIDQDTIIRAIKLAMKTPSVCNRQGWHIYHTSENSVKKSILKYQNGNTPFGENIPNLFIVTADLKAFFAVEEHYQQWIDGGLLAMSLIYALHSLGLASCPLNWCQSPQKDKLLRELINIKDNHTIILILAAGYPDEGNKVCVSKRRPVEEIYTNLTRNKNEN